MPETEEQTARLDHIIELATVKWRVWLIEHPGVDNRSIEAGHKLCKSIVPSVLPAEPEALRALCADDRFGGPEAEAMSASGLVRAVVHAAVVADVCGEPKAHTPRTALDSIIELADLRWRRWLAEHPEHPGQSMTSNVAADELVDRIIMPMLPTSRTALNALAADDRVWRSDLGHSTFESLEKHFRWAVVSAVSETVSPSPWMYDGGES